MHTSRSTIAAALLAAAFTGPALGQADNTNSLIAPANPPQQPSYSWYGPRHAYEPSYVYEPPRYIYEPPYVYERRYVYDPNYYYRPDFVDRTERRRAEIAAQGRYPTPYETDRLYGYPYGYDWNAPREIGPAQDSNPNDMATGIYNPKP